MKEVTQDESPILRKWEIMTRLSVHNIGGEIKIKLGISGSQRAQGGSETVWWDLLKCFRTWKYKELSVIF